MSVNQVSDDFEWRSIPEVSSKPRYCKHSEAVPRGSHLMNHCCWVSMHMQEEAIPRAAQRGAKAAKWVGPQPTAWIWRVPYQHARIHCLNDELEKTRFKSLSTFNSFMPKHTQKLVYCWVCHISNISDVFLPTKKSWKGKVLEKLVTFHGFTGAKSSFSGCRKAMKSRMGGVFAKGPSVGFPKVPEDGWTNAANQMITDLQFKCLLRCWGTISQTRGVYYIITGFTAWHMFQVHLPWSKRGGGWSNHNHEGARILTSYTTAVPVKREWWKMEVPLT